MSWDIYWVRLGWGYRYVPLVGENGDYNCNFLWRIFPIIENWWYCFPAVL